MLNLFKKKAIELMAVCDGETLSIEQVNDATFAGKMMGDGIAIIPSNGRIYAPYDAEVLVLTDSKHAIGLKIDDAYEVLIHVGIDTVGLKGEGFKNHVNVGQKVKQGDLLVSFDESYLKRLDLDMTTMIIMLTTNDKQCCFVESNKKVLSSKDKIITIK